MSTNFLKISVACCSVLLMSINVLTQNNKMTLSAIMLRVIPVNDIHYNEHIVPLQSALCHITVSTLSHYNEHIDPFQ